MDQLWTTAYSAIHCGAPERCGYTRSIQASCTAHYKEHITHRTPHTSHRTAQTAHQHRASHIYRAQHAAHRPASAPSRSPAPPSPPNRNEKKSRWKFGRPATNVSTSAVHGSVYAIAIASAVLAYCHTADITVQSAIRYSAIELALGSYPAPTWVRVLQETHHHQTTHTHT